MKPRDQLPLTEEELCEEVTRSLTAANPDAPQNVARYAHKERTFKFEPMVEQLAMHCVVEGHKIRRDSEEAAAMAAAAKAQAAQRAEEAARMRKALGEDVEEAGEGGEEEEAEDKAEGGSHEDVAPATSSDAGTDAAPVPPADGGGGAGRRSAKGGVGASTAAAAAAAAAARSRNQFVFKDRAMQTAVSAHRDKCVATEPAPRMTFSGACNAWALYDWYCEDQRGLEAQKVARDKAAKKARDAADAPAAAAAGAGGAPGGAAGGGGGALGGALGGGGKSSSRAEADELEAAAAAAGPPPPDAFLSSHRFARATKIMERIVSQNACAEVAEDFKCAYPLLRASCPSPR